MNNKAGKRRMDPQCKPCDANPARAENSDFRARIYRNFRLTNDGFNNIISSVYATVAITVGELAVGAACPHW
jgi:hypothetical protein